MNLDDRWLLPDGIEEVLPAETRHLERLRREVLDLFESWGYRQVMTPMIEFIESLLIGAGHDLDLQTFKLIDQISGRLMGLRADITPQVARIDARNCQADTPSRFCYVGTVLHTQSDHLENSRSPLQVGAELYGHAGIDSDLEVINLMLKMFSVSGLHTVYLDLGHVGIYRSLVNQAGLSQAQEAELFDHLQRKAAPDLRLFFAANPIDKDSAEMLSALLELHGDASVLDQAVDKLARAGDTVRDHLREMQAIATALAKRFPQVPIHVDLAELRGYHYHRGVVFAAFVEGYGRELARGGRYDGIGKAFGRSRPATGFSADLKTLARLANQQNLTNLPKSVFAPSLDDSGLASTIDVLRQQGWCVIQELAGQIASATDMDCEYQLVKSDGIWEPRPVATSHNDSFN